MKPDGENVEVTVKRIINEEGEDQESAPHSKQVLYIELEGGQANPYDILRRQEPKFSKAVNENLLHRIS